jgi:hypothetical protein
MNPIVRAIGNLLRLVGISSPEDALPKVKSAGDPPSWRDSPAATGGDPGGKGDHPPAH